MNVTLTQNKRSARYLLKQYGMIQKHKSWHTPNIMSLSTWLSNFWDNVQDSRILISNNQERLLWYKILNDNNIKDHLLIELAIDFHNLVNKWEIQSLDFSKYFPLTDDIIFFQKIYQKFKQYCYEKKIITISELPNNLIKNFDNNCYMPSKIIFAGFDEYYPQLKTFIKAIKKNGVIVDEIDPNNHVYSVQNKISCLNFEQEIEFCSSWAKNILFSNKNCNIGIVIPNLMDERPKIFKKFKSIIDDETLINISAGIPLNTVPIINDILLLLKLKEPFAIELIIRIFQSPYIIGYTLEKSERILLSGQLRYISDHYLSIYQIKNFIQKYNRNIPIMLTTLYSWQNQFSILHDKLYFNSEWVNVIYEIMNIFRWPGENNLTEIEFAALNKFLSILQEMKTMDFILGKNSYFHAVNILQELIFYTTLQVKPEKESRINILGTLEAVGVNFDYLWVMGKDIEHWPTKPNPNPFLPISLQKQMLLPHASADRELLFCEALIARYKRSAPHVIFSHAIYYRDREIKSSPLIDSIPEVNSEHLNIVLPMSIQSKIRNTQILIFTSDNFTIPIQSNELVKTSYRLIESQSLCPFQAFMEFRLKIPKYDKQISYTCNKIHRGILVHKILKNFWMIIKNQKKLQSLSSKKLDVFIEKCVDQELQKLSLTKTLYILEKSCIIPIISKLMTMEKTRSPFTVIAIEQPIIVNFNSISINLRIDRIDKLYDDQLVLIDYKVGNNIPNIANWFLSRPSDIQLPLYCLDNKRISEILIVQIINQTSINFKKINLSNLLPYFNNKNNFCSADIITWLDLTNYWQKIFTKIVHDFTNGIADINPSSPIVCKKCSYNPICRNYMLNEIYR